MQRFDNGISLTSLRNGLWSVTAFGIVACASAPMPVEKLTVAKTSIERAEQAQAGQFAQVELQAARTKLAAAQSAADKRDTEAAARMADQADIDAQLAESTARAKQQEQLVTEMDAGLRDLRNETLRRGNSGSATPQQPTPPPAAPPR
jgi:hypothetical protein